MNIPLQGHQIAYIEKPEVRALKEQTRTLNSMLSGRATFDALNRAVQELRRLTPDDCDVLIIVGNIAVREATFVEPHTFTFEGFTQDGHRAFLVQHFSQLNATVIYRPKASEFSYTSKVLHGFNPNPPPK